MAEVYTYVAESVLVDEIAGAIQQVNEEGRDDPSRATLEAFVRRTIELGWLKAVTVEAGTSVRYAKSAAIFLEAAFRMLAMGANYDFVALAVAEPVAVIGSLVALSGAFEEGIELASPEGKPT